MPLTRDQHRARHAYECVAQVPDPELKDYKVVVNGLGPNIVRSGLAATVSFLQRYKNRNVSERFAKDLAGAIPAEMLPAGKQSPTNLDALARLVRELEADDYMLLTRETLKLTQWFKRAVQATVPKEEEPAH